MLGVFADNHYFTFALDYLAFFTDFLNGWLNLHFNTIPFLFRSPCYATFCEVVNRNFNVDFISGHDPYIVHTEFAGNMRRYYVPVGQLYFEGSVR